MIPPKVQEALNAVNFEYRKLSLSADVHAALHKGLQLIMQTIDEECPEKETDVEEAIDPETPEAK